jgi:flagellar motor switch protein FliN/FliY
LIVAVPKSKDGTRTQEECGPAMADNLSDGLLSQADIDAAMAAAGLEPTADPPPASAPAAAAVAAPPETRLDSAGRPFDEVAAAMAAAIEAEAAESRPAPKTSSFEIPKLSVADLEGHQIQGIDLLRDVELDVKIELGRSRMLIDDVLRLGEGSVVELDKLAGDPVDVFVNDRLVARGEVLVLNDNFCVRINDIMKEEGE